jgi:hypothetical protein
MSALTAALATLPMPVVAVLALRYLPDAVLTLLAGIVALFSRDPDRTRRAMALLRLLRTRTPHRHREPGQ